MGPCRDLFDFLGPYLFFRVCNVQGVGFRPDFLQKKSPELQSINQYVFQDFTRILLTGYMVNHSNNPRTDIGKPVFMTDLPMQLVQVI